jgi:hypothetical protein
MRLLAHPREDGPLTDQLTFPLCHGGLDLACIGPTEGDVAYLAAAATTHARRAHGVPAL